MGQATGPVPAGHRDLSRRLGLCLPEGQTSLRLETGSQPTLRRPQPNPLLPDSADLAGTCVCSPPAGNPWKSLPDAIWMHLLRRPPSGQGPWHMLTVPRCQSVPGPKSMAVTSVPPPSMSPGPLILRSHGIELSASKLSLSGFSYNPQPTEKNLLRRSGDITWGQSCFQSSATKARQDFLAGSAQI